MSTRFNGAEKRVTIDDDGYKSDGTSKQSALKKAKTNTDSSFNYSNGRAYDDLAKRLKKDGVKRDFEKMIDDTSKQVITQSRNAYKILINNEKDLDE